MDWTSLLAWLPAAQYGGGGGSPGWGPGMMMYGFGYGWMGYLMMFIFWGIIIVGAFALIRWLVQNTRGGGQAPQGGGALDILKERYARGELSKEQFESMKKDILS